MVPQKFRFYSIVLCKADVDQQFVTSVDSSSCKVNPNFESLTPAITWSLISTDISSMRRFMVLLESDTLSNFATDSSVKFLTNIFATGEISDSVMT